jgi:hypothetical protein
MSAPEQSDEAVASQATLALDRLIAELEHDQADLSAAGQAVIPEEVARGKRAVAEAISAAKRARAALET